MMLMFVEEVIVVAIVSDVVVVVGTHPRREGHQKRGRSQDAVKRIGEKMNPRPTVDAFPENANGLLGSFQKRGRRGRRRL